MNTTEADCNGRPSKRRRFYRKRIEDQSDDLNGIGNLALHGQTSSLTPFTPEPILQDGQALDVDLGTYNQINNPVGEVLRQRKAMQRRKAGIEFSNTSAKIVSSATSTTVATVEPEEAVDKYVSVTNRFAPQTGQVGADVDKHMYAFPLFEE